MVHPKVVLKTAVLKLCLGISDSLLSYSVVDLLEKSFNNRITNTPQYFEKKSTSHGWSDLLLEEQLKLDNAIEETYNPSKFVPHE